MDDTVTLRTIQDEWVLSAQEDEYRQVDAKHPGKADPETCEKIRQQCREEFHQKHPELCQLGAWLMNLELDGDSIVDPMAKAGD